MKRLQYISNRHGALLLCTVLAGCVHKQAPPPVSAQAQTPNIYVAPPPVTDLPPMQADTTPPKLTDAKPAVAEEVKPKKKPKRQAVPPPAAPPAPAPAVDPAPVPEGTTLGELGTRESTNTKQQQDIAGKLASVEKRLNDLPNGVAEREQKQIAKVRLFVKEAYDASKSGDVEGAGILATKAELLLDDIAK